MMEEISEYKWIRLGPKNRKWYLSGLSIFLLFIFFGALYLPYQDSKDQSNLDRIYSESKTLLGERFNSEKNLVFITDYGCIGCTKNVLSWLLNQKSDYLNEHYLFLCDNPRYFRTLKSANLNVILSKNLKLSDLDYCIMNVTILKVEKGNPKSFFTIQSNHLQSLGSIFSAQNG
jgi:hypothetical protein